jgi:hypothetical protein
MNFTKEFNEYKKVADTILDYKLCCAHLDFNGSINRLAERIMQETFHRRNSRDINLAIRSVREKHNAMIEVPSLKFKKTTSRIMREYINKNFDSMVRDVKMNGLGDYPLKFKEIIDKASK